MTIYGFRKWANRWGPWTLVLAFVFIFVLIICFDRIFIFIKPGQEGVLWSSFTGTDLKHVYTEGLNIIWPWDVMYLYDVRIQQVSDQFHVLSRDGLRIETDVSIRFHPHKSSLPFLHVEVGPDYVEKVIKPEIRANLRYLMGQYTPAEIYTSQGFLIRRTVENSLPELAERHIVLDDLLIKGITLPATIQVAIEEKMRQQQAYLEYEFRLQREEKEKDRKRIEAEGIQAFQTITQSDGNQFKRYLTYLGVYATLALSKSENAKVVIMGNGGDGLPVILNIPETTAGTRTGTTNDHSNGVNKELIDLMQTVATNQNFVADLQLQNSTNLLESAPNTNVVPPRNGTKENKPLHSLPSPPLRLPSPSPSLPSPPFLPKPLPKP